LVVSAKLLAHSIDEKVEGPASFYTGRIIEIIHHWPADRAFCHPDQAPLGIQALGMRTPNRPYYVGFKKCLRIHATPAEVQAVIDDVGHYVDLFPGAAAVRVVEKEVNETTLEWERKIPVFFVPNIKYQITYLSSPPDPRRRIYRYQFKGGERLLFNDGMQVVESAPDAPNETLLTNYEYYEADYSLGLFGLKAVSAPDAWKESLRGTYQSLLAIRLKSEHPDWDYPRIEKERDLALKDISFDAIAYDDGETRQLASPVRAQAP